MRYLIFQFFFSRAFLLRGVIFPCAVAVVLFPAVLPVFAQDSGQNVAVVYPVNEESVQTGDIITRDRRTYTLRFSRVPNSQELFGVIVEDHAIVYQLDDEEGGVPILRSGQAEVNVTLAGGEIEPGDIITSSYVPGFGRKAGVNDQYQLGIALEGFDGSNSTTTVQAGPEGEMEVAAGSVFVDLDIGPTQAAEEKSTAAFGLVSFDGDDLLKVVRILIAGVITVGAIYSSFQYFGDNLTAGISSIGRNPMAKGSIQRMVFVNLAAIILISFAGIGLGALVLFIPI